MKIKLLMYIVNLTETMVTFFPIIKLLNIQICEWPFHGSTSINFWTIPNWPSDTLDFKFSTWTLHVKHEIVKNWLKIVQSSFVKISRISYRIDYYSDRWRAKLEWLLSNDFYIFSKYSEIGTFEINALNSKFEFKECRYFCIRVITVYK